MGIASRGVTYGHMSRYAEALSDLTRNIELDPEDKWAINQRGECLLLLKRYSDGLKDFDRAIELDRHNDWPHYDRALAHLALKQADAANADLARAIELAQQVYEKDPLDWRNTFNLALYTLVAQKPDRAQDLYQEVAHKEIPIERIRAAIRDLEDLLAILPNYPKAEQMRDYLESFLEKETPSS